MKIIFYYFYFSLLCISMLFVTCSENTTEPTMTNSKITGKVTDTNGNLLHDVDIYLVYALVDILLYQFEKIANPDTVSLTSFTATAGYDEVELHWETATETNNQGFEIQRKTLNNFEAIGFVSGHGTSTEPKSYSFIDTNVTVGNYFYRLKQIDFDGSFDYSDIIEVDISAQLVFALEQNYPNPAQGTTTIKYSLTKQTYCNLEIKNYYNSETLVVLVNKEQQAGIYIDNFNNSYGLTNNIYKIYLKAVSVYMTEYEEEVTMLLNEDNVNSIIETQPFIKTVNGNFEIKLSDLPLSKTINNTLEGGSEIIKQQEISNLLKFVLHKDGYIVLESEYLIDLNGQNKFNFVMEKR